MSSRTENGRLLASHGKYDQMTREQLLKSVEALEATRREEEKTLRFAKFALDNADDAVYWIRPDASLIYINEAACRMLGYAREELLILDRALCAEGQPDP